MLNKIRDQIGTAGLIVSIVALIAALTGGAMAATGGSPLASSSTRQSKKSSGKLTKRQLKEVEKVAKKVAIPGPPGPAGTNGTNGTNGKDGTSGTNGKSALVSAASCGGLGGAEVKQEGAASGVQVCNGKEGKAPAGQSFIGTEEETIFGAGLHPCNGAGGVLYTTAAEKKEVCNGQNGQTGFTETLPTGKVETGTWAFSRSVEKIKVNVGETKEQEILIGGSEKIYVPISFPIPLEKVIASTLVHFQTDANFAEFCGWEYEPGAFHGVTFPEPKNSGEFCVYENTGLGIAGTTFEAIFKGTSAFSTAAASKGTSKTGAVLRFTAPTAAAHDAGTWAVKG